MEKNIAVVGCGYWGKNLVRNFHELGVLRAICDLDGERLARHARACADVRATSSFEEILNDREVAAVAIATPALTHFELARKALSSGKDVFVEKPLAMTVRECEDLVALAEERGRIVMVDHILRYHPAIRKLEELIENGGLGQIRYIYSNRLNIGKLRKEENILWSFAPHDISVILSLVGRPPVKVTAFGEAYLQEDVYDTTLTKLEFSDKLKAHIFVSWLHPFKEQKLVVVGRRNMAVFDDLSEEKLFLYPHTIKWVGEVPIASKAERTAVPVEKEEPLKNSCLHFIDCVRERKAPLTDGSEGLAVLRVLQSAQRSLDRAKGGSGGLTPGRRSSDQGGGWIMGARYFVHESACVDENCEIGEGTKIWHFSHILKGSRIGRKCVIGQNVMIGPGVRVGDGCKIQNNVSVYTGVTLEDEVFVGPSAVFTNVYNPRAFIERKKEFRDTVVKRGAAIGANATIVCGVTIGRYAFVGAGAVVKGDVPDYALVVGVPARLIGHVCKCATTLRFDGSGRAACGYCGSTYRRAGKAVEPIEEKV